MSQLTAPELLERVLEGNRRWAEGNTERDLLGAPTNPLEHEPPVAVALVHLHAVRLRPS